MATSRRRYRRPWRPASLLPPTPDQVKQLRQLYSSEVFTQQERDDTAEWLASGEATRQSVSFAIGVAQARKEAHDKQHAPDEATQPPAVADEANPYMNNPARLEKGRNALWPE